MQGIDLPLCLIRENADLSHVRWSNHVWVASTEAACCYVKYANVKSWVGVCWFEIFINISALCFWTYWYKCWIGMRPVSQLTTLQSIFAHFWGYAAFSVQFMVAKPHPELSLCFKLRVIIFNLLHSVLSCKHIFTNDLIWLHYVSSQV